MEIYYAPNAVPDENGKFAPFFPSSPNADNAWQPQGSQNRSRVVGIKCSNTAFWLDGFGLPFSRNGSSF